ncbi:hypothetical protein [Marimonas lutisalis]|uniref:hypothetical protein n=1 Tax=Marimonas lutisalis TaxID=2545756 RepID=UPI0010F8D644|nr:hypothetical protein [Marimonas lutisalis]
MPDYIVEGGEGDDLIDDAYMGDPEGDMIDNMDNMPGNPPQDDIVVVGGGDDTVLAGEGDDSGDDADSCWAEMATIPPMVAWAVT